MYFWIRLKIKNYWRVLRFTDAGLSDRSTMASQAGRLRQEPQLQGQDGRWSHWRSKRENQAHPRDRPGWDAPSYLMPARDTLNMCEPGQAWSVGEAQKTPGPQNIVIACNCRFSKHNEWFWFPNIPKVMGKTKLLAWPVCNLSFPRKSTRTCCQSVEPKEARAKEWRALPGKLSVQQVV